MAEEGPEMRVAAVGDHIGVLLGCFGGLGILEGAGDGERAGVEVWTSARSELTVAIVSAERLAF